MQKINFINRLALIRNWIGRKVAFIKCIYRINIKRKKSFYNSEFHQGNLPIRVLKVNFEFLLINVNPIFYETLVKQIKTNGLQPHINYSGQRIPILGMNGTVNSANITISDRQIHIYDTYAAYLWCICYSMIVLFDEVIQKPHLRGNYNGIINSDNSQVSSALGIFEYAMTLRKRYRDWDKALPNPEEYNCLHAYYIEKTSGIYLAALQFIFCHEVGHNLLGHVSSNRVTPAQSLTDELAADNFAIDQILLPDKSRYAQTYKYGSVAAMCSLLFLNKNLYRGGSYPDAHERINNVIVRLELDDRDNIWGMASLAFRMWGIHYKIDFNTPQVVNSYCDLFKEILIELQRIERPNL